MNNYLSWNESLIHLMNYFVVDPNRSVASMRGYLILARANHSFNFLLFSPFVWKEDASPTFLLTESDQAPKDPVRPSFVPKIETYTKDEAVRLFGTKKIDDWTDLFYHSLNKTEFYSKKYTLLGF